MKERSSILTDVMNEFYTIKDHEKAKEFIIGHITKSKIFGGNQRKMIVTSQNSQNLEQLQTYITNSMFKYMRMGL